MGIREDERRRRRVRFLLSQDDTPSRSLVRVDTAHDGGGIEQPGSTPTIAHPGDSRHIPGCGGEMDHRL